jgi:hypothetical protein
METNLRYDGATVRGAKVQSDGAKVRSDSQEVLRVVPYLAPSYRTVAPRTLAHSDRMRRI